MSKQMVEVNCVPGDRVAIGGEMGRVQSLLREERDGKLVDVVALVYWRGGRKSFESHKQLRVLP